MSCCAACHVTVHDPRYLLQKFVISYGVDSMAENNVDPLDQPFQRSELVDVRQADPVATQRYVRFITVAVDYEIVQESTARLFGFLNYRRHYFTQCNMACDFPIAPAV
ncbi:hypothetical protein BV898_17427 [Hypsibius exemplaris]|uniref:Uncharacterized protein n=1 Tax=Hypsibius exemplaris TaxID=2072580 RepID=A0A9X6NNL3_HYPEX|nr:hypothetical protein BV898_17427 [Hypsibius exemplaris]